jgi:hypothetical protein
VQSGALRATINNVQLIELNTVRPLLPHTLDQVFHFSSTNVLTWDRCYDYFKYFRRKILRKNWRF